MAIRLALVRRQFHDDSAAVRVGIRANQQVKLLPRTGVLLLVSLDGNVGCPPIAGVRLLLAPWIAAECREHPVKRVELDDSLDVTKTDLAEKAWNGLAAGSVERRITHRQRPLGRSDHLPVEHELLDV